MQTLWQLSLQYLITFNENHAQLLPPTLPRLLLKHKLKWFPPPPLSIFFSYSGKYAQRRAFIPGDCLLVPSKYLQDEIKPPFENYIIVPLLSYLHFLRIPSKLVKSVQHSHSPGGDQQSLCGRQNPLQVLINACRLSWEKAGAMQLFARKNKGSWNRYGSARWMMHSY